MAFPGRDRIAVCRSPAPLTVDRRRLSGGVTPCRLGEAVRAPEGEVRRQPGQLGEPGQPGRLGRPCRARGPPTIFNEELLFANHPRFTRGCGPRAFVWCVCIWRRLALWTARISCEPKIQMSRGALGRSAATVRGGGAASPVHSVVT